MITIHQRHRRTDGRTDAKRSHDRYIAKACSGKNVKSSQSHKAHTEAMICISIALSRTPVYTARHRASASRGVPVNASAFAGTHCAYNQRDGQAELTKVQ